MPIASPHPKMSPKKGPKASSGTTPGGFNPLLAGQAIVDGLEYLKSRLEWSGSKVARVLHLPANTVNTWLKNGIVPIHSANLQPDVQAVVHLLAIHRSLEAMFENTEHQRAWLTTEHPELKLIPEVIMTESLDGLIFIRQYLDYARGRGA
jgi:hypothetical protein